MKTESAVNSLLLSCGARYKLGKGLGSTEMVSSATLTLPSNNVSGSVGMPFPRVNGVQSVILQLMRNVHISQRVKYASRAIRSCWDTITTNRQQKA